jgi:hypothetical protein
MILIQVWACRLILVTEGTGKLKALLKNNKRKALSFFGIFSPKKLDLLF